MGVSRPLPYPRFSCSGRSELESWPGAQSWPFQSIVSPAGLAGVGDKDLLNFPHPTYIALAGGLSGIRGPGCGVRTQTELSDFIHQVPPTLPPEVLSPLPSPRHLLEASLLEKAACPHHSIPGVRGLLADFRVEDCGL